MADNNGEALRKCNSTKSMGEFNGSSNSMDDAALNCSGIVFESYPSSTQESFGGAVASTQCSGESSLKRKASYSTTLTQMDCDKSALNLTRIDSKTSVTAIPSRFPGQFKDITKIGKSSCDEVFKSVSMIDQQTYVIKILHFASHSSADRAMDEVRTFSALSKHNCKNIVRYYGSWIDHHPLPKRRYKQDLGQDIDGDEDIENNGDTMSANLVSFSTDEGSSDKRLFKVGSKNSTGANSRRHKPIFNEILMHLYIQMEYCESTLADWLVQRNCKPMAIVDNVVSTNYAKQILKGMDFIHRMNIVHRDLRPSNIFLKDDESEFGTIKIGDFGISVSMIPNRQLAQTEYNLGQYYYTPPEVEITYKYDVFSAGIVFFELAKIFSTFAERHYMLKSIKDSCSLPIGFGPSSHDFFVIVSMVSRNPEDRPSMNELVNMMKDQKITSSKFEKKKLESRIKYLESVLNDNKIEF